METPPLPHTRTRNVRQIWPRLTPVSRKTWRFSVYTFRSKRREEVLSKKKYSSTFPETPNLVFQPNSGGGNAKAIEIEPSRGGGAYNRCWDRGQEAKSLNAHCPQLTDHALEFSRVRPAVERTQIRSAITQRRSITLRPGTNDSGHRETSTAPRDDSITLALQGLATNDCSSHIHKNTCDTCTLAGGAVSFDMRR